jgi:cyclopropane fatty-acyl-phospholipid synthase-like methyltransferase
MPQYEHAWWLRRREQRQTERQARRWELFFNIVEALFFVGLGMVIQYLLDH